MIFSVGTTFDLKGMYLVGIQCNTDFFGYKNQCIYFLRGFKLVICKVGCCIWIFQAISVVSDTEPKFHWEKCRAGLQILILCYSAYALSLFPHCTHIMYNTLLYILQNTNQNKVSETDHGVTQKLTQSFLLLSSRFLSIFWGVNASAIPHMVKYAISACQSMSEFRVNPHEYVTLSAWINKNLLTG